MIELESLYISFARRGDEIERLKSYVEGQAMCPCCEGILACEEDCTFAADCPDDYDRMMAARDALTEEK